MRYLNYAWLESGQTHFKHFSQQDYMAFIFNLFEKSPQAEPFASVQDVVCLSSHWQSLALNVVQASMPATTEDHVMETIGNDNFYCICSYWPTVHVHQWTFKVLDMTLSLQTLAYATALARTTLGLLLSGLRRHVVQGPVSGKQFSWACFPINGWTSTKRLN